MSSGDSPEEALIPADLDAVGDISREEHLYKELGELARFIDTTMKTIARFRNPVSATAEQLPEASSHLLDVKRLTEQSTHEVMRQVEALQHNHRQLTDTLIVFSSVVSKIDDTQAVLDRLSQGLDVLAENDKRLTDILTTLSFQDLVAQRVNKLTTILDDVEHKLLELVVVFGPFIKGAGKDDKDKAGQMLKQLEASKSTAMSQALADEILKQFGFN